MQTVEAGPEIVTTGTGKSKDKTVQGTLTITYSQPGIIPTAFIGPPDDLARLTYTEIVDGVETTWTSDAAPLSITVQGRVKRQFAGIFAATLQAAGQPDVEVEGGFVSQLP